MSDLLDAINACLAGIGLAPVSDEDDTDLDASTAKRTIERISKEIQQRGWFFNKEYNWNLVPDSNTGQVVAPSNALSIVTDAYSRNVPLALRDGKLYDLVNHTYDLTDLANYEVGDVMTIQTAFIFYLEFNNLPPIAQTAILYTARRQFAQDLEVDERRWKFQKEEEQHAMSLLEREDMRNRKHNYLTDNPSAVLFQSKVGGRNSYSSGLSVFPRRDSY
jgi:hypothetical protein